jgi:GAF domain-containing protein
VADSLPPGWPAAGNPDLTERSLLQSVAETARSVFSAAAASVFLLDRATGELVFEAVAGEGEEHLVGVHFARGTGIAGWVAAFGEPMLVDNVDDMPQFAREAAESTGYVPRSIVAAPLIRNGDCIGVLEVLDRGSRPRGDLGDVDLLGLLATEVAIGLDLLLRLRWMRTEQNAAPAVHGDDGDLAMLGRIAQRLPAADGAVARTVRRLLATADDLLSDDAGHSRASPPR